jgi:hypothetical protein
MAEALGASADEIEWTVSSSVSAWVSSSEADQRSHRTQWPVMVGIALFIVGTIGCALATSVGSIVVWRIVQAIGASAGIVLSRAIVRDMYSGDKGCRLSLDADCHHDDCPIVVIRHRTREARDLDDFRDEQSQQPDCNQRSLPATAAT